MKKDIQKPIILGNYYHGDGEMAWGWWMYEHAQLAIIGDQERSPRRRIVSEITELLSRRDQDCVYMISTEKPEFGKSTVLNTIPWVEEFSDPPEHFDDRQVFIDNRHFFSSSYFNLQAKILDIPRGDLLPPISFRPHIEGPLKGYRRAIEGLSEETPHKEGLVASLNSLSQITWIQVNDQGYKFYINTDNNIYEQALDFLTAAWSFWSFTCQTDAQQQMLLVVELPKDLLRHGIDPMVEKIVFQALNILRYVSLVTTTTLVLSSEMLYPAPELNFRYKLLLQTHDSDVDFTNDNIRSSIDSKLLEEWEQGNNNIGLWMDDTAGEIEDARITIRVGHKAPEIWEDFEMA
ncbi:MULTISPECIES: hypothetical protein [unclassified Paenibacillus]|uniref:Uncharacterized protein n=1 Tax=Paenibacillus provencensis TaxID=441151 RepID=A0ABW3QC15_9BACL|nr:MULTISPECIES: hypothetical protein [unclassified Paenibacillus]MCM3130603.1 hypothetical protein [Paenibacillus sp. MER 78]SDX74752.1 hypothetical protein SAMN05518848_11371 [Paenibacillus sp. PDC88]SFS89967.1 hypothetical protein SAMN04488601_106191 [Paenibacillus sp. 453mf]